MINETSAKLWENKEYIHVPADSLLEDDKKLVDTVTKTVNMFELYSESKFGVSLEELMVSKSAIITIELFDEGQLAMTLTNQSEIKNKGEE